VLLLATDSPGDRAPRYLPHTRQRPDVAAVSVAHWRLDRSFGLGGNLVRAPPTCAPTLNAERAEDACANMLRLQRIEFPAIDSAQRAGTALSS